MSKLRGEVLCGNIERGPAYPNEHALDGIKPYSISSSARRTSLLANVVLLIICR